MKLNNDYVNISEIAGNLSSEFEQFEPSEENALRLLFQRATDASTAAQTSQSLTNRLRAMGYDQFVVRFDSSGISIIDGGPLEVALDAWVKEQGPCGDTEWAVQEIRSDFYKNTKGLDLRNCFLRTLPPILHLLDLTYLDLSGNELTAFDATRLPNLTYLNLFANKLTAFDATGLTKLTDLDLRKNKLTAFDTAGLDNLNKLDLSGNKLTAFNARGLPKLTYLNLNGNQLTTFDAEGLDNLDNLDLNRNQLTIFDSRGIPKLTRLYISENQLTTFDDRGFPNLIFLDLSRNKLTAFDAAGLPNLDFLNLSRNKLITFDHPTELANLTELLLNQNQLTTFHAIHLPNLLNLNLSENQLTIFDAERLDKLIFLDLAYNVELSNLPLALCQCRNLMSINSLRTQIPNRDCNAILARCRELKAPGANPVLRTQLDTWISASGENFNLDFILKMTGEESGVIHEWLTRLERTKDFTTNSQRALAKEVCSMLRDLNLCPVFRESFFAQVPVNNEACGDRAGMAFNELFLSWRLARLPQSATGKEKLQLFVEAAKTLALREALQWMISNRGGNPNESAEIYLYYERELKERLQLLTAIKNMLYPKTGQCTWINEEELVAMVNSTYIDALCKLPQLKELALKDPKFAEQYHAMNEEFTGMLENLGEGISNQVYLVSSEQASRERGEKEIDLLRKWVIPKLAS